ncbi:hypothetical protein POM88_027626 [Heracleum sosnowskyi]|uniref:Uncharacterized protein n=1 Tax=Heracleum sosnowskyi TaxID=360622 RepID=A0AAD8MQ40_9APIA|nr:hypothetical protein POM88_027626 [Heracleum sosnowskyi]
MVNFKVYHVESAPIEGQKPGTSGLRKKKEASPAENIDVNKNSSCEASSTENKNRLRRLRTRIGLVTKYIVLFYGKRHEEVIFYGHEAEVFGAIVHLHIPESEILILTVQKRDDIETESAIGQYDSQIVLFDHSLQFGVGSSGAALINEEGNVVGIQSGEILSTYLAMSEQPLSDALDLNEEIPDWGAVI